MVSSLLLCPHCVPDDHASARTPRNKRGVGGLTYVETPKGSPVVENPYISGGRAKGIAPSVVSTCGSSKYVSARRGDPGTPDAPLRSPRHDELRSVHRLEP